MVDIKETDLKILFTEEEIQASIKQLAEKINLQYKDKEIYVIAKILNIAIEELFSS